MSSLEFYRKRAGLTQAQLANKIGQKSGYYIGRIESGLRPVGGVSLGIAVMLADALGLENPRDLLGELQGDV